MLKLFKKAFLFVFGSFWRFFRMLFLCGMTVIFLILEINSFLDSSNGTKNLAIIVSLFVFLPIFIPLFVEIFYSDMKRKAKNEPKRKTVYVD